MTPLFYPKDVLIQHYHSSRKMISYRNSLTPSPPLSLLLAIYDFNLDAVQSLIQKGVSLDTAHPDKITALHLAAMTGQPDCVDLLLQHGADVNASDLALDTALHLAADHRFKWKGGTVEKLLEAGAEPHWRNNMGQTALHIAATTGSMDELMVLIPKMRHLETESALGNTALESVVHLGELEPIRLLLEAGANPDRLSPANIRFAGWVNPETAQQATHLITSFQEKKILKSHILSPSTPGLSFHPSPKVRI